jgi:UDP-N-acetyl-D-mannosaminuronic acid dehydrogenase
VDSAPELTPLIQATRRVNDSKPNWVIEQAIGATDPTSAIACLGLAYKADIDDLRESPAMIIVENLAKLHTGEILVVEPNIAEMPSSLKLHKNIKYCEYEQAVQQADTVIVLTDHKEFKDIDRSILKNKKIIDTRGIWHKN